MDVRILFLTIMGSFSKLINNHIMCFVKEHKDNLSELGSLLAAGSIPDGAKATQFFNLNFGGFSPSWDDCVRVARL